MFIISRDPALPPIQRPSRVTSGVTSMLDKPAAGLQNIQNIFEGKRPGVPQQQQRAASGLPLLPPQQSEDDPATGGQQLSASQGGRRGSAASAAPPPPPPGLPWLTERRLRRALSTDGGGAEAFGDLNLQLAVAAAHCFAR